MRSIVFALPLLLMTGPDPARAVDATGAATPLILDLCEVLSVAEEGSGAELRCPGPAGTDAFVSEGDLRFSVALGNPDAPFESFGPFNTLGKTMDWRLGAEGRPFAGVVRYLLTGEDGASRAGELLVVLKVGSADAPGCRVAVIDATVNPDARAFAARIADERAASFRCGEDQAEMAGLISEWTREMILPALEP